VWRMVTLLAEADGVSAMSALQRTDQHLRSTCFNCLQIGKGCTQPLPLTDTNRPPTPRK